MKLMLILSLLTVINAVGSVYSQNTSFNLSMRNTTVLEVLNSIEKQSKFKFFYQNEQIDVKRIVSIDVRGAHVEEILDHLFVDEDVKYKVLEDNLVVLITEKAQQNKVTGIVTSGKDAMPLAGVSIIIKGTNNGTVTDVNGKYSIDIQSTDAILVFSYIGFHNMEITTNGQTEINVKLEEDISRLEEIVVVGYGIQKKSLVTGAISSVKSQDIQYTSISRAEQVLQGKTSGVQVIPASGSPGAGMEVRVRGYGSNGNSEPIYIVDGVKASDIAYLDPNDIASMEVLKDAASSAIYGAEGGNGVIMVTTKKGETGKTTVNYDVQHTWQSVGRLPKLMDTEQYSQYMGEAGLISNVDKTYNTDWLKEIFAQGYETKHHLTFSGGNDKSTYLLSLSYLVNDGIITGSQDKYERYTIRLNDDNKVNQWLKVGNNFGFTHSYQKSINELKGEFGGVVSSALQIDPTTPVEYTGTIPAYSQGIIDNNPTVLKAPDGNYYGISQYVHGEVVNPFVTMAITNGGIKLDKLNGSLYTEISPIKGFTFTSRLGLDVSNQNNHYWNPVYYYTTEKSNGTTVVVDQNDVYNTWAWENFASFSKNLAEHNITLLAGMEARDTKHRITNAQGGPMVLALDSYSQLDYISSQDNDQINGRIEENKLVSYFGRLSYDFSGKYLLQGSIRRDGAALSQLSESGRWGVFPSFSAGWVISNETFFPKTVISNLKIRGSWGQNGSLSNLSNYPYASLITSTSNTYAMQYPLSDGTMATVMEPSQLSNPDLTWETSQQTDFGIDLRAFGDKLTFTVDYYKKTTKDLITNNNPSLEAGNLASQINGGNVENKGFEFNLGYKNLQGDFKYAVDFNLSTLKNEVTYLNPLLSRISGVQVGTGWNATMFEQGQPMWYFYGYKTHGIDKATGSPIFVTKDGKDTTAAGVNSNDMQNIGNPIPKLIFGTSINLAYKDVDLSVTASGTAGNKVMMAWIRNDRNTVNRPTYFYDGRWTTPGQSASKPGAAADSKTWNSDQIVFDGSYLRIQQIQLGYRLPSSLLNAIKISSLRVYVSLDNFFTITKYKGMDPQASPHNQNEASAPYNNSTGIDRGTYPIPRDIMVGASVSF